MARELTETEKDLRALQADLPALEKRLEDARRGEKAAAREARASGELEGVADAQRRVRALERLVQAHREEMSSLELQAAEESAAGEVQRIAGVAARVDEAWEEFYAAYEAAHDVLAASVDAMLAARAHIESLGRETWAAGDRAAVEAALKVRGVDVEHLRRPVALRMVLRELSPASRFVVQAFQDAVRRGGWS